MVKKEPVLTNALIMAVLTSGLAVAMSMGWIVLSDEQLTNWLGFLGAVMVLGGIIVRQYVTPVFKDD